MFIHYKSIQQKLISNDPINKDTNYNGFETNIDLTDEFFRLEEVKKKLSNYNLTYIETITGYGGNIGNALIILNNLINICINIKCRNIIAPSGKLSTLIKKPIFNKEYNFYILPNSYRNKTHISIELNYLTIFLFRYKNKYHGIWLRLIRDEVLNNIPKYKANPADLYINIRSGDIFINQIHHLYSQPPLCFYQKIINENIYKYKNIYILSNGHENPIVNELLKIYPKIKYIHGSEEYDSSIIINAYNFVMSISTFPMALISLNNNLKNLYLYQMMDFDYFDIFHFYFRYANYVIHVMKPSKLYFQTMYQKWKKSKEQLDLMLNETCINNNFTSFYPEYKKYKIII